MKYLKKIFEDTSNSLPNDIQDAILGIEDEFGQADISKETINGVTKYVLKWSLFGSEPRITHFIEKIEKMYRVRHDIGSLIGRLSKNYETKFNFDQWGYLIFYIQTKTALEYNFIKKIDEEKKIVYLIKSEILKYFTDEFSDDKKPIRKMEKSDYNNRNSLKITFKSKQRGNYLDELVKFIKEEIVRVADDKSIQMGYRCYSDYIFFIYFYDRHIEYYEIILVDE